MELKKLAEGYLETGRFGDDAAHQFAAAVARVANEYIYCPKCRARRKGQPVHDGYAACSRCGTKVRVD